MRHTLPFTVGLLFAAFSSGPVGAAVRHVPGFAPTIQAAIDASGAGDTVLVAPGTYVENLLIQAAQNGIVLRSSGGAAVTTVDANQVKRALICRDVGPGTRIEGFTFANGRATSVFGGHVQGGGVLLDSADVVFTDNVIRDSQAHTSGGGIFLMDSSPLLARLELRGNVATNGRGGGLYSGADCRPVITQVRLVANRAAAGGGAAFVRSLGRMAECVVDSNQANGFGSGGGLYVFMSDSLVIEDCVVRRNQAGAAGGVLITRGGCRFLRNRVENNSVSFNTGAGVYCFGMGNAEIRDNLIVGNTSAGTGGGLTLADTSNALVVNNTIVGNGAPGNGGGVYVTSRSMPTLSRNIVAQSPSGSGVRVDANSGFAQFECNDVWGNAPGNYSGLADPTGLDGNQSADPLFCDPGAGDYGLMGASPCAPAQSPAGCGLVGAKPVACGAVAVDEAGPNSVRLAAAVPNPARGAVRFAFTLARPEPVSLAVYDARGRRVRLAPMGGTLAAGAHAWTWDRRDDAGRRAPAGLYFARLGVAGQSLYRPVVLLD